MKTELISRLLLGLFIMFVLVKFVGPFLFQILWDNIFNKKKKKSVDLDVLINRKKQLMQKGNPEKKIVPRNKHKNNTQRTLARYKAFLEQLSGSSPKDEKKINDVRDIIRLFDNLQWGDGPEFYSLGKKIKEGFSIDIPQTEICDAFKEIIQNDFLLSGKSDNLPTLKEILNVIEMRVLLNTLVDELFSKGGPLLCSMAQRRRLMEQDLLNATLVLFSPQGDSLKMKEKILKKEWGTQNLTREAMRKYAFKLMKSPDNKFFSEKKELFRKLFEYAEFFSTLYPIVPPSDKNDLPRALEIFQATDKTPIEDIKKIYKKLALKRHPDKLSSRNIPPGFSKVATKNFSTIQFAYDIILNNAD